MNLLVYRTQGQYAQAGPLYQRALAIKEKALGPEAPLVATSLNNLAALYDDQGQYAPKPSRSISAPSPSGRKPWVRSTPTRQGDSDGALTPSGNRQFLRHARAMARFVLPATESSKLSLGQSAQVRLGTYRPPGRF